MGDEPIALTDPIPLPADGVSEEAVGDEADGQIEWVDEGGEGGEGIDLEQSARFHERLSSIDPADLAADEIRQRGPSAREPEASPERPAPGGRKPVAPGTRPAGKKPGPARPAPARPRPEAAAPVAPGPGLAERIRRHRNGLIFLTVALVVVATVALRARRARLQQLPGVAERGVTQGLEALDEGRFDTAFQVLTEAREAVDTLGSDYDLRKASAIRQGAKEAEVVTRLAPASLEDMLDEAARTDARDWPGVFRKLYQGRTVLIDAEVVGVPDSQGRGGYELDYRVLPPGEGDAPRSVGVVDTSGFRLFELTQPKRGYKVTFGARLASFRYDTEAEVWRIGLEPDSGVSITHHQMLEKLGWPSGLDEPVKEDQP